MNKIDEFQKIIDESNNIVFFGGAGVSTESGIPDFRSVDGLYNQKYDYPPETILSHRFFYRQTKEFYKFYRDKILIGNPKPNACHNKLVELEKNGKLTSIITQNIDGLHTEAGSKTVYEIHGSIKRNYCVSCRKFFDDLYVRGFDVVPYCDECGDIIKPDVVLYEESLDSSLIDKSISDISRADTLIVAGTSLTVYPAAGFIKYFKGKNFVLINLSETSADHYASLVINDKIGEVFSKIKL